jgi:ubiquinone/menaquinone biosynthesis C-methylase UbiE
MNALHQAARNLGGSSQLFSAKVKDYLASRPAYPLALFQNLQREMPPPADVADIGAGTGLLTQGLLNAGYRCTAVEPDPAMRAAADAQLGEHPGYRSVDGVAECLPLAPASVDVITAAQAFHWFDVPRARLECQRVLRPGGHVLLVWNERDEGAPIHLALNRVFANYGGALRQAQVDGDVREGLSEFFGETPQSWVMPHAQSLSAEQLLALVFSRSYMPARDSLDGQAAERSVIQLHQDYAGPDRRVRLPYRTEAFWGGLR